MSVLDGSAVGVREGHYLLAGKKKRGGGEND